MKEKLLALTQLLVSKGFTVSGFEVEAQDIVKITFDELNGLELLVNKEYAQIDQGDCDNKLVQKLKKIIETEFVIKEQLVDTQEKDIFTDLLNAA
jgi:hypothetical protein